MIDPRIQKSENAIRINDVLESLQRPRGKISKFWKCRKWHGIRWSGKFEAIHFFTRLLTSTITNRNDRVGGWWERQRKRMWEQPPACFSTSERCSGRRREERKEWELSRALCSSFGVCLGLHYQTSAIVIPAKNSDVHDKLVDFHVLPFTLEPLGWTQSCMSSSYLQSRVWGGVRDGGCGDRGLNAKERWS